MRLIICSLLYLLLVFGTYQASVAEWLVLSPLCNTDVLSLKLKRYLIILESVIISDSCVV